MQFRQFANEGAKISIKSYFMRSFFFSVYWAAVKCQPKLLPFGLNCRLQLAGLRKKEEESIKPTCFTSKATSLPQTPLAANHSQCSLKVEVLNLIIESKSQPVELDTSTIELHMPSRWKNSLRSYCSVDFDFLALMRFDMNIDVALCDDSSFGKLTNSCN